MDGSAIAYAGSKDWVDIMKNRSKVRMHELIERLGLRAKWSSNKRGKTNFESALLRELVQDMGLPSVGVGLSQLYLCKQYS